MKFWGTPALLAGALATILAGCGGDPNAFDEGVAKGVAEAEPFQLDSEASIDERRSVGLRRQRRLVGGSH